MYNYVDEYEAYMEMLKSVVHSDESMWNSYAEILMNK